jgi:hypothetical protein
MANGTVKKSNKKIIYPEVVYGSRQGGNTEQWKVEEGDSKRGDAWTNFDKHVIKVPLVDDETASVVRGHELIHARISPDDFEVLEHYSEYEGLSVDSILSAEEVRVNTVLKCLGYKTELLTDGSEKESGKRLAKEGSAKAYDQMITFGAGLVNTSAFRAFINGVRSVDKEWALDLRELEKSILKEVRSFKSDVKRISNDRDSVYWSDKNQEDYKCLSRGFLGFSAPIAGIIEGYRKGNEDSEITNFTGVAIPTGKGKWAKLRIHNGIKLDKQVRGRLARRKKPAPTGSRIAYPSRLLTDPERRIFSQKPRDNGGIVLLDLSGSMSLSIEDIDKMVEASPGALVAGYSHNKGKPHSPNFWVLADRGKRVSTLSGINYGHGNGVDGPALNWALSKRRGSEPIIWVCDGIVTTDEDKGYHEGGKACAEIIKKHKILVTPTLSDAIEMLRHPSSSKSKVYGIVGIFLPKSLGGQDGKEVRL